MELYGTLGASCARREILERMFQAGMTGARLNLSHTTLRECAALLEEGFWPAARRMGVEPPVGNLLSSDVFYSKDDHTLDWGRMGVLAVEMETASLYCNAAEAGRRALAICTISDSLVTGEKLPALERQTSFRQMIEIALATAVAMDKR